MHLILSYVITFLTINYLLSVYELYEYELYEFYLEMAPYSVKSLDFNKAKDV